MFELLLTLYWSFLKVGLFTIGGGYAMIPLMEAEVIKVNNWLSAAEFLDIIAVAEMTPGPVSINAATFIGYRLAGVTGSLVASFGVITPSLVSTAVIVTRTLQACSKPQCHNFYQRPACCHGCPDPACLIYAGTNCCN
jgi:chromate transport protein ChrA